MDEYGNRILGCRLTSEQVRIPDTVVYKGGFPAQWYFHSKTDGRFMKKKPQNIVIPKIFEAFGADNGTCDTQVVAIFVGTVDAAAGPTNQVSLSLSLLLLLFLLLLMRSFSLQIRWCTLIAKNSRTFSLRRMS